MRFLRINLRQMSPSNLHKKCTLRGTLVAILKNCDLRHSKNILNTCHHVRIDAHNLTKLTFQFKHKPLLSSYAHGKSNVQVIITNLLSVKLKLIINKKINPQRQMSLTHCNFIARSEGQMSERPPTNVLIVLYKDQFVVTYYLSQSRKNQNFTLSNQKLK